MSTRRKRTPIPLSVSIYSDGDGVRFEIDDDDASVRIVEFEMTPEQFCAAMGRLVRNKVGGQVGNVELFGKKMEVDRLLFPMPDTNKCRDKDTAIAEVPKYLPDGWVSDDYFGSQGSFYTQDGKPWASVVIRRWVEKEVEA